MANILVVDDEHGIRDLLFEILNDEGHQVDLAQNAAEARQARMRSCPDLVLLDIWMPDTDGVSLLKEWAGAGQLTMPVVMMSGHATIETAVTATKLGAMSFLEKPITLQKLMQAVDAGLKRSLNLPLPVNYKEPDDAGSVEVLKASVLPLSVDRIVSSDSYSQATPKPYEYLLKLNVPLREAKEKFDLAYFSYHLEVEHGSVARVAEKTGLERTHLYRKLKQLGIDTSRGHVQQVKP